MAFQMQGCLYDQHLGKSQRGVTAFDNCAYFAQHILCTRQAFWRCLGNKEAQ